jgi:hypothetical protein
MGAWGTGVFDNDVAADVRSAWRDGVIDGNDLPALTAQITKDLLFAGEEDVFWPALAAAQHETGRLDDAVRDRALEVMDAPLDADEWEVARRLARGCLRGCAQS